MEELLSLKWNNHKASFFDVLATLRGTEQYSDVVLACDGKMFNAHRIVLSTCSEYFFTIFKELDDKNLVIVLRDIRCQDLEALLDYMYLGEVNVKQSELSSLIKVAEWLQLRGLAVPDTSKDDPVEPSPSIKRQTETLLKPRKRKKNNPTLEAHVDIKTELKAKLTEIEESSNNNLSDIKIEEENIDIADFKCDQGLIEQNEIFNYSEKISGVQKFEQHTEDSQPGTSFQLESQVVWQDEQSDTSGQGSFIQHNNPEEDFDSSQAQDDHGMDVYTVSSSSSDEDDDTDGAAWTPSNNQEQQSRCPYCPRTFQSSRDCKRHIMVHTKEKPFGCPFCEHRCNRKGSLKGHISNMHEKVRRSNPKAFLERCRAVDILLPLARPIRQHATKNVHITVSPSLRSHRENDRDVLASCRPAPKSCCSYCPRTFHSFQDLKRHIMIHTKEKPFGCPFCEHRCNRKGSMKGHIWKMHESERLRDPDLFRERCRTVGSNNRGAANSADNADIVDYYCPVDPLDTTGHSAP